jgi:hypothetical protein
MFDIDRTYHFKEEEFKVKLSSLQERQRDELIQESQKNSFLKLPGDYLVLNVYSKKVGTDIVLTPDEVVPTIDLSIDRLIELEMYEQCIVLKDIKDTFNIFYKK